MTRWEAQFLEAKGHDLWASTKLKEAALEEGAGLTPQRAQNLGTSTHGRQLDYINASWALRRMDATGSERPLPGRPGAGATMSSSSTELEAFRELGLDPPVWLVRGRPAPARDEGRGRVRRLL